MPNTNKIQNCFIFLRANATFGLNAFIDNTGYSLKTSKKYLSSQLAQYVEKNGDNYSIINVPDNYSNFEKSFKQTSRIKNTDILKIVKKSQSLMLAAIHHYNNPYSDAKAAVFIPQAYISFNSLFLAIIKKYKKESEIYEIDATEQHTILQNGKKKTKDISELIKIYKSINHKKLTELECDIILALIEIVRLFRNEIEHGSDIMIDLLLSSKCHALLLNYELLLNREFDESINNNLVFPLFCSEKISAEQKISAKIIQEKEYRNIKDILTTYNASLSPEILNSNLYDFKIYAFPKFTTKEKKADITVEFLDLKDLNEDQKEKLSDELIKIKSFQGAVGDIVIKENGIMNPQAVIKKIKNGKPVVIED